MTDGTLDGFLGGRVRIRQPAQGYRAGIDPVLLAAAVPARSGECVLEIGIGSGVALLCLMARVPGLDAIGVERNTGVARLAAENAALNGLAARVVEADLRHLPSELRGISFDHVFANPPYFDRQGGSTAVDSGREGGRGADTPLSDWVETAIRRLKPGGTFTVILRAELLPEGLASLDARMGDVCVLPLVARTGRVAKLIILQSRKGAKGPFRLLSPFVLHQGDRHVTDGDDYSPAAKAVLRDGAPLDIRALGNA